MSTVTPQTTAETQRTPATGRDGALQKQPRAAGKVIAGLVVAALVVISLAAVRSTTTPEKSVTLMADSSVDFASRLSSARASRGGPRETLVPAVTTTSTTTPPAPVTAKPKPKVVAQAVPKTTAKPAAKPAAAKPAAAASPAATSAPRSAPARGGDANAEEGKASWYEAKYHASNPWICAHKTIAKGQVLTVTNVKTGAQITCEVGDRGPYVEGRILDLSKHAFSQLAPPSAGLVYVRITWG